MASGQLPGTLRKPPARIQKAVGRKFREIHKPQFGLMRLGEPRSAIKGVLCLG